MKNLAVASIVCVMCGVLVVAWPEAQAPQAGQQGGGRGGGGGRGAVQHARGTLTPKPLDPGRPWGWAVKAFMENPNQKLYNTAKQKLLDGKQIFSHTISRFDVDAYCQQAPHYDFTWFEMQHSTMWFADVERMVAACPRVGATPILRVPDALEGNIQKAMDMGMLGIIVPTVDDALEAREAARYARFPPTARRSSGGGQAGTIWGPVQPSGMTFRQTVNDNMLVIVMIETLEGVDNALEIAAQPGVDVVIQGNSDLTSFSGFQQTDDRYQDLLTRVRDATYQAGKFWGNAGFQFATGNRLSPDSRFHQNGPAHDGWVNPGRGAAPGRGAQPGGRGN
jgi:2-keto-3-deoxy-L-rhamnonate aldolase RhmA